MSRENAGRLFLLALGTTVGLLLLETGVRLVWPSLIPEYGIFEVTGDGWLQPANAHVGDDSIGWRLKPKARYSVRSSEFEISFRTNAEGFRGTADLLDGASGTEIWAAIGDSITEALQVPETSTFCRGLEERFARSGQVSHRNLQVQNFGVSSFGFPHYLAVYRNAVRRHRPRLVLVFAFPVNDIADSSTSPALSPVVTPRFSAGGDGRELLGFSTHGRSEHPTPFKVWLRTHFALYRVLLYLRYGPPRQAWLGAGGRATPSPRLGIYAPLWDAGLEEGWANAAWSIEKLARETRSDGADLRIVVVPGRVTSDRHEWAKIEAQYKGAALSDPQPFEVSRRLRSVCERLEVPLLDLEPDFALEYDRGATLHFPLDGHLTPVGHRLVTTRVAQWLEATLRPTP